MDQIQIKGGKPLQGEISISGSKNSALPILACTLLTDDQMCLSNVPKLSDVTSMLSLLKSLNSEYSFSENKIKIISKKPKNIFADYNLVRKMRASFLVLGPLLARYGSAKVSLPGGCAIGSRPINMHLVGLEKLGANFEIEGGYVKGNVKKGLFGTEIDLPFSSVGATENILMAATLATGKTIIKNAAMEPEVEDLCNCLNKMGAEIKGVGSRKLEIFGKKKLTGCNFSVMPDRIEAGTYILALLGCSGSLKIKKLNNSVIQNIKKTLELFTNLQFKYENDNSLLVESKNILLDKVNIKTGPFPEFPTDLQAQLTAVLSRSKGLSVIEETIFENRFMHVSELNRMGADINIKGSKVYIRGKKNIYGAPVMATDLRASSSLVIAGLMARGETIIRRVYHLDRGYENLEKKLSNCNAQIKRLKS